MNWLQAGVLGVVQGLTEFLPVSSSGHLVLASKCLGLPSPGLSFSIWVHVGTAVATVFMLREEITWLMKGLFFPVVLRDRRRALELVGYVIAASVPAALVGIFLKEQIEASFSSSLVASIGLIVTGCFLWLAKKEVKTKTLGSGQVKSFSALATATFLRTFVVGMFQAAAILPGVSRSGLTMTSGIRSGMDREDAARFSFLLSLPAIIGSALLDVRAAALAGTSVLSLNGWIGSVASFFTGLLALFIVFRTVRRGKLWKFSYYCWAVGIAWLCFGLTRPCATGN